MQMPDGFRILLLLLTGLPACFSPFHFIPICYPASHLRLEEEQEFKEFAALPGATDRIFARIAPQVG
jgi:hypothetical protein